MNTHHFFRTLWLCILVTAGSTMGCDDESTQKKIVDAMVDTGPECDPGEVGQETCKNRYGEQYFCTDDGACAELEPCETVDCCSPGQMGDQYCVDLCDFPDNCPPEVGMYGPGSICAPNQGNGNCTERACIGCTYDETGHGCCSAALGETWYCGGSGRCVQAMTCEGDDCCVPGAQGDAHCKATYGESSGCTLVGNTGRCLRPQAPPCADCRDTSEGHACCAQEFGGRWYCNPLEGICRSTSGCELDECCVPGSPGDEGCQERFSAESRCIITDGDGRCSTP